MCKSYYKATIITEYLTFSGVDAYNNVSLSKVKDKDNKYGHVTILICGNEIKK